MRSINPIANGCLICIKIIVKIKVIEYNNICKISRGSLFKILILEINEKKSFFSLEVLKKKYFNFDLQDQCFY